jgi:hypothetical protein
MIRMYDTDRQWRDMVSKTEAALGALPRRTRYGQHPSLVPLGEYPDKLVDEADYKEVIEHCHAEKIFSLYHQRKTWGPPGFKWYQNGLPYCWAWSAAASLMDCEAREDSEVTLLSPVSLGWLVNWRQQGYYLDDTIAGMMSRGICEMRFTPDPHDPTPRKFVDGWEENALLHRVKDAWDADNSSQKSMIRYAISLLRTGIPCYIAYNWWRHALELVGLRWDESQVNNLVWQIRNSHGEDDLIELTGSQGVPDELYAIRSTLRTAA